jgi:hypothetical protein
LLSNGNIVLLYSGNKKYRQDIHAEVLNIDVSKKDLHQCADAVMRLRADLCGTELHAVTDQSCA